MEQQYAIEMLNITKRFPGIVANDNITLQLKKGEIHALLGENGAGKSTLMSVLFGLYQPEEGEIRKDGKKVTINNPNDANDLGIGMVHQHFKLVECFSVLDNIVLGVETTKNGLLKMDEAKKKVMELSEKYGLIVDPDALIEDISVGMQQRTEILKMLYRDNEILIFDEPTAVLTPQEIKELMQIMKNLAKEGKSILFISHKLAEIMEVADRCSVLRKGKYIGTVDIKDATPESLSSMMVGRDVNFKVEKSEAEPREEVLHIEKLNVMCDLHDKLGVKDVSFNVKAGEIVCIAGIDGNGQRELVYGITGLRKAVSGKILLEGKDVTNLSIRERNVSGISHIPNNFVIEQARHPVVENHLPQGAFVANSINLTNNPFALITGPNMAGKSTYLRQNALIALLAQIGSFVPAKSAHIGVVDKIFCRVGASDNLARGESTFLVEMAETANILRSATAKSLVIMDEVGRGTSTEDGLSIAWAVSEHLLNKIKCKTLFATHYHELTRLKHNNLQLLCLEVLENDGEVVFLKRIKQGASQNSYGLHVAKLAGVPTEVVNRSKELLLFNK